MPAVGTNKHSAPASATQRDEAGHLDKTSVEPAAMERMGTAS
jgi:hypothetical protein